MQSMTNIAVFSVAQWGGTFDSFAELREVFALAKKNSGTLGFLPNSAFTDRGRIGHLLIGRIDDKVVGYCLFDVHRAGHIKLVHVCVDDSARGTGLGKALIDAAIDLNPHANGVLADCRRDYEMDRFWRSVGMGPKGERAGRALRGTKLVRWWRPLGGLDLFEDAALNSGLPLVTLDSNIVSDLYGLPSTDRPDRDASLGLLADWLEAAVTFAVSPQVDHEINGIENSAEREAQRSGAANLIRLRTTRPNERSVEDELAELIGPKQAKRDKSLKDDIEHLADAIRAGADFFITNDTNLINKTAAWLTDRYDIEAVRPHQLISKMATRLSRPIFQSSLIESVDLTWVPASNLDGLDLESAFVDSTEPVKEFRRRLRGELARPADTSTRALLEDREKAWALLATRLNGETLSVPFFRVLRGTRTTTVALQLARYVRRLAVASGAKRIEITDAAIPLSVTDALRIDGFQLAGATYSASVLSVVEDETELKARGLRLESSADLVELENTYWPLLVLTERVPTYLVPIQPRWAERLFGFPSDALFHVRKTDLGLSREHVYFNGGNQLRPGPARLLWYVTKDRSNDLKQLAARSRLIESVLLRPEEAHKKFGHLGVLSLRDIRAAARKDGLVNVIRFADTELLRSPLKRGEVLSLLETHRVKPPILTTREVPAALFNDVATKDERVAR